MEIDRNLIQYWKLLVENSGPLGSDPLESRMNEALKDIFNPPEKTSSGSPSVSLRNTKGKDGEKGFNTYKYKDTIKGHGWSWNPTDKKWMTSADTIENLLNGKVKPTLDEIASLRGDSPEDIAAAIAFLRDELNKLMSSGESGLEKQGSTPTDAAGIMESAEEVSDKLHEFQLKLMRLTSAKEFADYMKPILEFKTKALYKYSLLNSMLIWLQDPEATAVLSASRWADKNRYIKPGAKLIALWVPNGASYADEKSWLRNNGYEDITKVPPERLGELNSFLASKSRGKFGFTLRKRFADIRFTAVMSGKDDKMAEWEKGKENLKNLVWFDNDQEPSPAAAEIADALYKVCEKHNVDVRQETIKSGARGYTNGETITLMDGRKVTFDFLKTAVHELTHALCHFKNSKYKLMGNYAEQEQQAEMCAWIVCYLFGYNDTKNTALNYIGGWGVTNDKDALKVLNTMSKIATDIYNEIVEEIKNTRSNNNGTAK